MATNRIPFLARPSKGVVLENTLTGPVQETRSKSGQGAVAGILDRGVFPAFGISNHRSGVLAFFLLMINANDAAEA